MMTERSGDTWAERCRDVQSVAAAQRAAPAGRGRHQRLGTERARLRHGAERSRRARHQSDPSAGRVRSPPAHERGRRRPRPLPALQQVDQSDYSNGTRSTRPDLDREAHWLVSFARTRQPAVSRPDDPRPVSRISAEQIRKQVRPRRHRARFPRRVI